eukprot:4839419-Pleurochrysis_carterae.AAC.1
MGTVRKSTMLCSNRGPVGSLPHACMILTPQPVERFTWMRPRDSPAPASSASATLDHDAYARSFPSLWPIPCSPYARARFCSIARARDEKKGKARLYHGPIFWNYGCIPQTWEDPTVKGDDDVGGAFGDNDPLD